jgi:hypothetical protein
MATGRSAEGSEAYRRYADAFYSMTLIAPTNVLAALLEYQSENHLCERQ